MTRTVPFYFDFISHNAYLAWVALPRLAARHDVVFEPVPAVFGALLKAHGQSDAGKERLRDQTEAALECGVPSFRVGDALFWGHDDIASLDEHLAGDDPLSDDDFAPWVAVSPSLVRRR